MYCIPGNASSARIPSAKIPPKKKNNNVVMKYRFPITL